MQLSPHLHVLVPEGQWSEAGELVVLPSPEDEEVEAVLHRLLRRVRATLAEVEELRPEDVEEALWAEAAQHRLGAGGGGAAEEGEAGGGGDGLLAARGRGGARHRHGRPEEAVCVRGAGAGGGGAADEAGRRALPLAAEERCRGDADGGGLPQRLLALVPPKGLHLACFHGVFAPNASLRGHVMQQPPAPPPPPPPPPSAEPRCDKTRGRPRLDWATALQRTFGVDVWRCPCCGGRRRVRAVITQPAVAADILRSLGLLPSPASALRAQAAPQLSLSLA